MSRERGFTAISQSGTVPAEGKVTDAKGRLCATARATCLVFDLPPG